VELLLGTALGRAMQETLSAPDVDLHVPSLCDVEIASALRGLVRRRRIDLRRATDALSDYRDFPLTRHGHLTLLDRMFQLRENFSCYDATYVALAESLDAPLCSGDDRLLAGIRAHTAVRPER
jgi:predicted nucleic acid-binding protein